MEHEIKALSTSSQAANLTMTETYLVVKGSHYVICNNYISKSQQTKAIAVKDILNMEYMTMHSKRLFMLFIILISIVLFGGGCIHKLFSATMKIDKEINSVERIYNAVSDDDVDINVSKSFAEVLTSGGIRGIVIIYGILVIGCILVFYQYFLNPFKLLLISTVSGTVAVRRKYYEKSNLDSMISLWKNQL